MSVGTIAGSIALKKLIDNPDVYYLWILGGIWISSSFLNLIKGFVVQNHFSSETVRHKGILFKIISRFPFSFLETKEYGDELNKANSKISRDQDFISSVEQIATAVVGVLGVYFLLLPNATILGVLLLTLLIMTVTLISAHASKRLAVLMYDYWDTYIKNTRKYNYFSGVLSNKEFIEEKKTFSTLPFFLNKFEYEFDFASNKNGILGKKRIRLEFLNDTIFFIYVSACLLILLYEYSAGQISIGLFISAIGYLIGLIGNIFGAVSVIDKVTQNKRFTADYNEFIEKSNPNSDFKIDENADRQTLLSLDSVSFHYPANETMVLNKFDASFKRGKKYAIVGANGCGKTTLVKLICNLYTPISGTIIRSAAPTVLFQDFNRYPATVKENITLSSSEHVEHQETIDKIIKSSGLEKRVAKMDLGHDSELTTLKEGGEELSGGEWQRLALARVLFIESELYILDEPTASLDPLEELRIFKAYNELLKEKTVIYITHRLGFVKDVDEIIVIKNGTVAEIGSHDNLLSIPNGIYKNMFEEQRSWYE